MYLIYHAPVYLRYPLARRSVATCEVVPLFLLVAATPISYSLADHEISKHQDIPLAPFSLASTEPSSRENPCAKQAFHRDQKPKTPSLSRPPSLSPPFSIPLALRLSLIRPANTSTGGGPFPSQ